MQKNRCFSIFCMLLSGALLLTGCGAQPAGVPDESDPATTTTAFSAASENTDSTTETQASISAESTSENATAIGTTDGGKIGTTAAVTTAAQSTAPTTLPPAPPPTTAAPVPELLATHQNASYKYNVYATSVTIIEYLGSDTVVNIPSTIDGLPVAALWERAFAETNIVEVTISSSVQSFGENVFVNCKNLTTVNLPGNPIANFSTGSFIGTPWNDALTEEFAIRGNILMKYNGNAQTVVIPDGVKMLTAAFMGMHVADTILVPESAVFWEKSAFACSKVRKVVLPKGLKVIPERAFFLSQVSEIVLPDTLEIIGEWAFVGCMNLKKLDIPDSVILLGMSPFRESGIEILRIPDKASGWETAYFLSGVTTFHLPNHATVVPEDAYRLTMLKELTIPSRIQSILSGAFLWCPYLETVVLEPGVKTIAEGAFMNDTSLKDITIPDTVNTIAENAFENCPKSLRIHGKTGSAAEKYAKQLGFTFVAE